MFNIDNLKDRIEARKFDDQAVKLSSDGKIDQQEMHELATKFEQMTPEVQEQALKELEDHVDSQFCNKMPDDQQDAIKSLISTLERVQAGDVEVKTLDPEYSAASDAANLLAPDLDVDASEELSPKTLNFLVMASTMGSSGGELSAAEEAVLREQLQDFTPEQLAELRTAGFDESRPLAVQLLIQRLLVLEDNGEVGIKPQPAPEKTESGGPASQPDV